MKTDIEARIAEALEEIRPYLIMHAGDVEFVGFEPETGIVSVSFIGSCDGCPMAGMTLKLVVERQLKEKFDCIESVKMI